MHTNFKNEILNLLIEKNPNWVSEISIRNRIINCEPEGIKKTLSELVQSNQLEEEIDNKKVTGNPVSYYRIKEHEKYPIKEYIKVGEINVPRLLSETKIKVFPEMLNEQIEYIAEYTNTLEKRFSDILKKEQRKYWSNILGIFGILVSVLALVIVGLPKIQIDPTLHFWDTFLFNLSQLLPIAVVLAIFVVVMKLVIR